MTPTKSAVLLLIVLVFALFIAFDLGSYLNLDYFNEQKQALFDYHEKNPVKTAIIYLVVYILAAGFSLPGAGSGLTLAGGAIFGFWLGTVLVSFASTIGATIAFLMSRTLLRDWVQDRFGSQLTAINKGVEKDGAFYLFSIRLIPAFPYFLVNMLMGLTPIKTAVFFVVSQIGMLAGTMVYVNAGVQLATIDSVSGIASPALLGSFVLLALFPFIVKKVMSILADRRALASYSKPAKLDANVIVVGAGSAGLVSSLIAATVNAKPILIEQHKMGGDCLNTGCVPSKALLRSAKIKHYFDRAEEFGLQAPSDIGVKFPAVMQRVQNVIKAIEPHDSVERYEGMGVQCEQGSARIISPWEVEVSRENGEKQTFSAANIIIASGARPFVPPIPGLDKIDYLTSDSIWSLESLPQTLTVMGAGPIGCEMAQAFARLGSKVTIVDMAPRIVPREDEDAAAALNASLLADGIDIFVDSKAVAIEHSTNSNSVVIEKDGQRQELAFERLLVAVGRKANTDGLGLDELGIETNRNGTVKVDDYLRSSMPTVYACGDVAGPYQFTHTASHQAWFATVNAMFGMFKRFKVDYSVIPWATFTDPQVARVGLNELEAAEKGIEVEVTRYGIDDLDRAIADGENHGFVKVLTPPGSDKILGVTIVGYHASELIAEYVLAMKHGLGLKKLMGTIHIYPTLSEANKFAASEWRKKHKPESLLQWVTKFHDWRRA
ncbi:MAG: FAD-dependent oxidoreductase [Pseudomonadales bacterium]